MELIERLQIEWAVVSQAPFTFAVFAVLMLGAAFGVARLLYASRIDSLKERIQLRDDQLADIRRKAGTDSPEELASKIDDLERRVGAAESAPIPTPNSG
ncbi:MAG: hypothetical protein AAF674_15655 [Pseudomonadota bacterium]